jgi:hypothetical protein
MEPNTAPSRSGAMIRLVRTILSPPDFDIAADPAMLVVAPDPRFRGVRRFAYGALLVFAIVIVVGLIGGADPDEYVEAALALLAAGAMAVGLTVLPKRLVATFAGDEVTVQEGGIRAPRWRWTAKLESYAGLAWRYHAVTVRSGNSGGMREVAAYHWIELVHPDRHRTLILCMQRGEAGMAERLDRYAIRLGRPVVQRRVEGGI